MLYKNIRISLTIVICFMIIAYPSSKQNLEYKQNINLHWTITSIMNLDLINKFAILISLKDIENSVRKIVSSKHNKIQHALNGNRKSQKIKNHFKIMQLNTGLSNWDTCQDMVQLEVEQAKADIAIIGESNMLEIEPGTKDNFKGYTIENKFFKGCPRSRITVLMRENIIYTRLYDLETDNNAGIWLKIKFSKKKYIYMLCVYRQWKLPPELDPSRKSNNLPDQLTRLDQLLAPLDSLAAEGKCGAVAGDLNIYRLVTNDPRGR